jgi:hypothetical protein
MQALPLLQALYTGLTRESELQLLGTDVASTIALGEARMKVYGMQPRWKKYLKKVTGRHTEEKFDEVTLRLAELTQQIWELQESPDARPSSRCGQPLWMFLQAAQEPWTRAMSEACMHQGE